MPEPVSEESEMSGVLISEDGLILCSNEEKNAYMEW